MNNMAITMVKCRYNEKLLKSEFEQKYIQDGDMLHNRNVLCV